MPLWVCRLTDFQLLSGQDMRLEAGSTVEMESQRPLVLQEARVTTTNRDLVPVTRG